MVSFKQSCGSPISAVRAISIAAVAACSAGDGAETRFGNQPAAVTIDTLDSIASGRVAGFLNAHRSFTVVLEQGGASRFSHRAPAARCGLRYQASQLVHASLDSTRATSRTHTLSVRLHDLSPYVDVERWTGAPAFAVRAYASDDSAVQITERMTANRIGLDDERVTALPPTASHLFEVSLHERAAADSLRDLLSAAIRVCGGRPVPESIAAERRKRERGKE